MYCMAQFVLYGVLLVTCTALCLRCALFRLLIDCVPRPMWSAKSGRVPEKGLGAGTVLANGPARLRLENGLRE
jgi:hypothetical protein